MFLFHLAIISTYVFDSLQSSSKKVIGREEWEKRLSDVKIRKEDMNKLVMNYLVTEGYVDAAEKFQLESGVKREQPHFHVNVHVNVSFSSAGRKVERISTLFSRIRSQ